LGKTGGIRLYVDEALGVGQDVSLSREQSHYLFGVMRRSVGDELRLFNGGAGAGTGFIARYLADVCAGEEVSHGFYH